MLTEDIKLSKRQDNPHIMVLGKINKKKKKEKRETKELEWDLGLWEGAVKEEKNPHTWENPHC